MQTPIIIATIGDFLRHGYTISVHCLACGRDGEVDLKAAAARLGRDRDLYEDRPRFRCTGCCSPETQTIVSPPRRFLGS